MYWGDNGYKITQIPSVRFWHVTCVLHCVFAAQSQISFRHHVFEPLYPFDILLNFSKLLLIKIYFKVNTSKTDNKFFKRFYLFIVRDRKRDGEREGEKHQCVVASHVLPTGDLACNPGMYPDWESNRWLFGSQPTLNPLSYTSQGKKQTKFFKKDIFKYPFK